ncbi:hypothetical protein TWF481_011976 [Arthrobotrys musiformis]|uniref:Uncharacterized protein n=1 Tax=Arthrobotrys musiformis TaxID=47236 RepID=A0AAV9VVP3_9PEZI
MLCQLCPAQLCCGNKPPRGAGAVGWRWYDDDAGDVEWSAVKRRGMEEEGRLITLKESSSVPERARLTD